MLISISNGERQMTTQSKFSVRPYRQRSLSTGKMMFWVNEYFWDHDHWAKYCHRSFATKAQAEAFIRSMILNGYGLI